MARAPIIADNLGDSITSVRNDGTRTANAILSSGPQPLAPDRPLSARLMLWAQQIVDRLNRRKVNRRDFDEDRIPMGHTAVPQPWSLERLESLPLLRLSRDEHCLAIDELV